MNQNPSYKPSVFYFRSALRNCEDLDTAVEVGLVVCAELERLKAWVRDQGMTPPRWVVLKVEAEDKGLSDIRERVTHFSAS